MRSLVLSSLFFCATLFGVSLPAVAAPAAPVTVESAAAVPGMPLNAVKLDLNTADAVTLQRELLGIGKAKSEAIVAYREANGNFVSVDELLEVDGIGKTILDRNRDKIIIN